MQGRDLALLFSLILVLGLVVLQREPQKEQQCWIVGSGFWNGGRKEHAVSDLSANIAAEVLGVLEWRSRWRM